MGYSHLSYVERLEIADGERVQGKPERPMAYPRWQASRWRPVRRPSLLSAGRERPFRVEYGRYQVPV